MVDKVRVTAALNRGGGEGGGGGERSHRFHSRPRFSFHAAESLRLGTRKEKTYQKNRQLGRLY